MIDWKEVWPDRVSPKGEMKKILTREEKTQVYIYRSKQVHGEAYDYSKFVYYGTNSKSIIICTEHREFEQTPGNHLKGRGCPICGGSMKLTTEEFIKRAKLVHGESTYDYSRVNYTLRTNNIIIVCKKHGPFSQMAGNHLRGSGCSECVGNTKKNSQQFIEQASIVHNNRYSYDKVCYVNTEGKVLITCSTHGDFEQAAYSHLRGCGCPKCGDKRESTHLYFLDYGSGIYKFGITVDLYGQRLPQLTKEFGRVISVIKCIQPPNPREVEQHLLNKYTDKPKLDRKFDGYTELRILTEEEVAEICLFLETI